MKFLSSLFFGATLFGSSSLNTFVNAQTLDVVIENNGLSVLLAAAGRTGQAGVLTTTEVDLTVFGPTDVAFQTSLPPGAINWLLKTENLGILSQIISFHVLPGVVRTTDLSNGFEQNDKTFVQLANGNWAVNGAIIRPADLPADNGILHIINSVLIPPDLPAFPPNIVEAAQSLPNDFSTLLQALQTTSLVNTLTSDVFTVFAPTNQAFQDLPVGTMTYLNRLPSVMADVLRYHVSSGEIPSRELVTDGQIISTLLNDQFLEVVVDSATNVTLINGVARIDEPDIEVLNGLVHKIDTVLIPPSVTIAPTVADVAIELGEFNTLLLAVQTAQLTGALNAPGPLTIFAPTDTAFGNVQNLDAILANNDLLTLVLSYHVVSGKWLVDDLVDGQILTTLATGQTLRVTKTFTNGVPVVTINGVARITLADVEGSNGVVHAINQVLIPETSMPVSPTPPTGPRPTQAPAATPTVPSTPGTTDNSAAATKLFGQMALLATSTAAILLFGAVVM